MMLIENIHYGLLPTLKRSQQVHERFNELMRRQKRAPPGPESNIQAP